MIREPFDGLACDLDGVVYRGDVPIEGAVEALGRLQSAGVRVVFCTNNSRSTVAQYVDKLTGMGIAVEPDQIVTSAIVTAEVLEERGFTGKRALVIGGDGIHEALTGRGIDTRSEEPPELVVVGWDPTFTYDAMKRAAAAVMGGATFIATNDDASFPAPEGLWPGAGAILASIERASGAKAEVMGKPHEPMMDAIERRMTGSRRIGMVGDRPDTDLAGGARKGWTTVLVLSGVTPPEKAEGIEPRNDVIIGSLADLGRSGPVERDQ